MAIKENVLPLAQDSGSGYIRTVSSGGASQRTAFDTVKGAITADMDEAIADEVDAREAADNQLQTEIDGKVDKVTGKGLSTNDFTNALKTKLDGIEAGAEVNVIETVKVNGTALVPDANRAVNVPAPTVDSALSTTSENPVQNKVITGAVNDLKEDINQFTEAKPDERQLYDNANPNIFNGYSNGVNFYASANHRIVYIPCEPNTEYTVSADDTLWTANGVYQSETVPVANGSAMPFSAENTAITVVENGRKYITNITKANAHYLAVFYYNVNSPDTEANIRATIMIAKGADRTEFISYDELLYIKEDRLPASVAIDTVHDRSITGEETAMGAGDRIEFDSPNIKKNNLLTFSAKITSFGSLKIGQGENALNQTAYIVIDSSTVKVYRYTTQPVEWVSLNHGLTIQDYIEVSIEVSNTEIGWAKLNIYSNGSSFSYARMAWLGCGNVAYAEAVSGSYANCTLKHYCADYDKEFWLFGDSYFDHWVTHALADGYSNFLCDGWSGRKAEQALPSLEILLEHGKPKNIVWCLGMNNGDTSSAVNANWIAAYNTLVSLCENNNINLILCTIPSTPTVNNNYKNAIIRDSGFQYVDLAKAVGSDISTSWYSGLLSSDNVHPSTTGDVMIAKFMETAIPQMMG